MSLDGPMLNSSTGDSSLNISTDERSTEFYEDNADPEADIMTNPELSPLITADSKTNVSVPQDRYTCVCAVWVK